MDQCDTRCDLPSPIQPFPKQSAVQTRAQKYAQNDANSNYRPRVICQCELHGSARFPLIPLLISGSVPWSIHTTLPDATHHLIAPIIFLKLRRSAFVPPVALASSGLRLINSGLLFARSARVARDDITVVVSCAEDGSFGSLVDLVGLPAVVGFFL